MKRVVFQAPREKHPAFGTIWRPVIEVAFRYGQYRIRTDALVDPGADITLLPRRLGDALHLKVHPNEPIHEVRGRLDLFDAFNITYKQVEGTLTFAKRSKAS